MNCKNCGHSSSFIEINGLCPVCAATMMGALETEVKKLRRQLTTSTPYVYSAVIDRIVDGDTLDVTIDLGFDVRMAMRIRLARINAPERFTPEGKDAIAFLNEVLLSREVVVQTFKDKKEKYGRYLADVFDENLCLNDALVSNGLAVYQIY